MSETTPVGRNEPCPCGSRKKYKRCCGVSAAPILTERKKAPTPPGFDPSMMDQFDPSMMAQLTQSLQKLPKGQMQRLQSIMQRAMSGKDVTSDAAELERSLPPDFMDAMKAFGMQAAMMGGNEAPGTDASAAIEVPAMTEEEARALVEKAAAEGKISSEQAQELLKEAPEGASQAPGESEGKFSKFWKNLSGKKS